MKKTSLSIIIGLLFLFGACNVSFAQTANNSFKLVGNEKIYCIAESLYMSSFFLTPQQNTTADVIFSIKNPMGTWYRVKLDKIPIVSPESGSTTFHYSQQQIKTCNSASSMGVEELSYWVSDKYIPENLKSNVVDMEAIGKQTLGSNSFNIDKTKLIRVCPSSTCEAQWLGGWGGIATVIGQNDAKNWDKVIVSNVNTNRFDEFGAVGWISKDLVPDNIKPLSIPPFSQNNSSISNTKNKGGKFNISSIFQNKKGDLVIIVSSLLLIFILALIYLFRRKITALLSLRKSTRVFRDASIKQKAIKIAPILLTIIVVVVIIGGSFGLFYYFYEENNQKTLEAKANYNLGLEEINKTVESNNEESQKQITALENKIAELGQQKSVNSQESSGSLSSSDINNLIGATVYVLCADDANHSMINQGSGSVWQFPKSSDYFIFTNAHVVSTSDGSYPNCVVVFPQLPSGTPTYIYNAEFDSKNYQDGVDWALLRLTTPFSAEYNMNQIPIISNYSQCKFSDVNIGDKVTIFGYPAVGGKNVTVTEGNISGFDGNDYKVSSGNIDHGNSGGVAVLNKSRCILGIPTWVSVGEASSVGIIESWRTIYGDSSK